ncbi:MAG: DUF4142 domain-containing protein, partial [Acidobacteriaceae bacterium]|nr:DUF4142 domain-containing protein [Acidobacteriaceae bacterium]
MRVIFCALPCLAICSLPAFAQGTLAKADQQFLDTAAQTDMMEAHLGQLAAQQAASSEIKDYAQMLVTDHTNDYTQLGTLATKAGGTIPKGLDAQHEKMIAPFEKLKGAAFDQRYVREMIAGHTKAIAAYKAEAAKGENADVKSYADQALPTLQKHLQGAQDLLKSKSK